MRITYTPTTTPAAPSPCDVGALASQVAALSLAGFTGCTMSDGDLHIEFPMLADGATLSDTDKQRLDAAIAGYVYTAPAPPANVGGLEVALHSSAEFTTAMLVALYGDPNGAALLPFIEVAAKTGDWTHAQTVYNDLRDAATLPAGWTKQQIVDLMTLASTSYGIQITP